MTVVILEDAADDIDAGRRFYESCEPGIGDYFVESILSDLDSLLVYAGIHRSHFGFHRMLSKRFPFGIYYEMEVDTAYVYAILACDAIRLGFAASWRSGDSATTTPDSSETSHTASAHRDRSCGRREWLWVPENPWPRRRQSDRPDPHRRR